MSNKNSKILFYKIAFILLIISFLFIKFPKTVDSIKLNYKNEDLKFIVNEQTKAETTNDIAILYDQGKGYNYFDKTKKTELFNIIHPNTATKETALFYIYEKGNIAYKTNLNNINNGMKKLKIKLPNIDGNFEITSISFQNKAKEVARLNPEKLILTLKPTNVKMEITDDSVKFSDLTNDSYVEIDTTYNSIYQKTLSNFGIPNIVLIIILIIIYMFLFHRNYLYKKLNIN